MNVKNHKVIVLVYQTYNYSYYKLISNLLDQLIKDNLDFDNNKFDLISNFLTNRNISYFVGYLDDQKDLYFLNDLYENSYYRIVYVFDQENKLIDNKIFFQLMDQLREEIDQLEVIDNE